MLLILILYALWAGSVVASKTIVPFTTPLFLTGIRMGISGLLLLGYQYFYAREYFQFKRSHLKYYAQITFFGIILTYALRFWALEGISASKALFLYNLSPFFSAIYSYFLFSEKLTSKKWLGLFIGCVGLGPILMSSSPSEESYGEFFFISLQEVAVLISVAAHAYSWIVMRQLIREKGYSPMMINGICMFAGGFVAWIASLMFDGMLPITTTYAHFFGTLAFIIIVSNIICHNLYGHLLRDYTATFLSLAGFLAPPFGALYGWLLFNEKITWHFYASSVIVFIGLYVFYKDELIPSTIQEEAV